MIVNLSADIICSEKQTVSYEEQIVSKDKYPRAYFRPKLRLLGNIRSRDAFRPIARKQKDWMDLMDYKRT